MRDAETQARALKEQGKWADAALAFARAALCASGDDAAAFRVEQAACWATIGETTRALKALQKALALGDHARTAKLIGEHPVLESFIRYESG